jgi:hypothetical protein
LCQVGRADEALGRLLGANPSFPYTLSVRALAFALIADGSSSLEDADLVASDAGATYLDRVIADIAASAVEAGRGDHQMAYQRLAGVLDIAESAGDVVAVSLTKAAAARISNEPDEWSALLGVGWRRVLDDLLLVHQPHQP